ncbi:MAG: serine hydrolase domain-containing protein [Nitriliruptorales bacterium]
MEALGQVEGWEADAAAGVTDPESTVAVVGDQDRRFPWASVTKLLTALTVLTLVEEGTIDLDEEAGPATVRHLLAHASGLPHEGREPVSRPERRRIYSSSGYEILGELVAERFDAPFADALGARVLAPLDMSGTRLEGSPAAGAAGPLRDLLVLGRELLDPTVISEEVHKEATGVVFPGLGGVLPGYGRQEHNDWGLGFEIRDDKEPHWTGGRNSPETFGHFGQSGSFLWVDPAAGIACGSLADRPFGDWAVAAWPSLADDVLEELGTPEAPPS